MILEKVMLNQIIGKLKEEEHNMQMPINVNLSSKERMHGVYKETSAMSQSIKDVFRSGKNWSNLNDAQRESLENIAIKLSRLLTGNAQHRDHWDDIAGYATLAVDNAPMSLPNVNNDIREAINQ